MRVALTEGDPLAIAAATMVLTGIRPGEAMTLRCATRRSAHRRSLEVLRNSEAAVTHDTSEFTGARNEAAAPEVGAARSD